ncbi:MerR family transcriptional regulator [Catenuloplanes atrovinosus]|uniref:MerR family transcriptional regulator n=1 Tax=Catenuloplanes atrovinosus TaxID=137266 RepID=UPI00286A60D0|nr:MerR family transcriptional regulator [Catenuloplanes atrovinosus]
MRIGDLAAKTGVSTRALRYYEEQGLLPAARTGGGQRAYPEAAVERVGLIQGLFAAGLSSRSLSVLLPCVDAQEATDEAITLLRTERDRIDRQIRELVATRDRLDEVIVECTTATPGTCGHLVYPAHATAG